MRDFLRQRHFCGRRLGARVHRVHHRFPARVSRRDGNTSREVVV